MTYVDARKPVQVKYANEERARDTRGEKMSKITRKAHLRQQTNKMNIAFCIFKQTRKRMQYHL